jgi:hypothetical protein
MDAVDLIHKSLHHGRSTFVWKILQKVGGTGCPILTLSEAEGEGWEIYAPQARFAGRAVPTPIR